MTKQILTYLLSILFVLGIQTQAYAEYTIITIAGTGGSAPGSGDLNPGGFSGDGGLAIPAELNKPRGIMVDSDHSIYFGDYANSRARKIDPFGTISTFAGNGSTSSDIDGKPATQTALGGGVPAIVKDNGGNFYVAQRGYGRVRKITPNGYVQTIAGVNERLGYWGDGGPAYDANFDYIEGLLYSSDGSIYVADSQNNRIRKIEPNGIVNTYVELSYPVSIAEESDGSLLACAFGGLYRISTSKVVTQIAAGTISNNCGVTVNSSGDIYVADKFNQRILKLNSSGSSVTTIAGIANSYGYSGDGGPATQAKLSYPMGVALDSYGSIYITDRSNHVIRKLFNQSTMAVPQSPRAQIQGAASANITWTYDANRASISFRIKRTNLATSEEVWVGTVSNNSDFLLDTNIPPGSYNYKIYAVSANVYSLSSSPVSLQINAPDSDGDGVADDTDNCPQTPNANQLNTDGDSQGNACDADDDNDGHNDSSDAFPLDSTEWADLDNDGIGDNSDPDIDGDGHLNGQDAFPLDSTEWADLDNDGIGNNSDSDRDGDGHSNSQDAFPDDASEWQDTDGDSIGDNADPDDDNDGYNDTIDAFPTNSAEWIDTDGDSIGDNADLDDDNDGMPDAWEIANGLDPKDSSDANRDDDGDGKINKDEYDTNTNPKIAESLALDIEYIYDSSNRLIRVNYPDGAYIQYQYDPAGNITDIITSPQTSVVYLTDAIRAMQICTGQQLAQPNAEMDVNNDGKIGIEEAIYSMQRAAAESE